MSRCTTLKRASHMCTAWDQRSLWHQERCCPIHSVFAVCFPGLLVHMEVQCTQVHRTSSGFYVALTLL